MIPNYVSLTGQEIAQKGVMCSVSKQQGDLPMYS